MRFSPRLQRGKRVAQPRRHPGSAWIAQPRGIPWAAPAATCHERRPHADAGKALSPLTLSDGSHVPFARPDLERGIGTAQQKQPPVHGTC
jgi:hypothetical protein